MQQLPYRLVAKWDADAQVWYTAGSDVPGLVIEAETLEAFTAEARAILPELLAAQGVLNGAIDLPLSIHAERDERIPLGLA